MNRRYTRAQFEEQRFFQLPKSLYENDQYKKLSNGAKVMYAILRDRQDLSIKNDWQDNEGYVYFYFDCRKLSEYINVSTSTINRYKKELISSELLEQERQGQGNANRMYILMPETLANNKCSDNDYTRNAKLTTLEVSKSLHSDTKVVDTELKDTENLHHFSNDGYLYNYLKKYTLERFDKTLRNTRNIIDIECLEDMEYEEVKEFLDDNIQTYDQCNLDYISTIQYRAM